MKFRKNDGKYLTDDFYLFRENARRSSFHPETYAESDQIEYELDTARITGADTTRNFKYNRAVDVFGANGTDIRELRDR